MDYTRLIAEREFTTLANAAKVVAARLRETKTAAVKSGRTLTKYEKAMITTALAEVNAVVDLAEDLLIGSTPAAPSAKSLQLQAAIQFEMFRSTCLRLDHSLPARSITRATKTAQARR